MNGLHEVHENSLFCAGFRRADSPESCAEQAFVTFVTFCSIPCLLGDLCVLMFKSCLRYLLFKSPLSSCAFCAFSRLFLIRNNRTE